MPVPSFSNLFDSPEVGTEEKSMSKEENIGADLIILQCFN